MLSPCLQDQLRVLWIGVPVTNVPIEDEDQPAIVEALDAFRCVPVFLSKKQNALFYEVISPFSVNRSLNVIVEGIISSC